MSEKKVKVGIVGFGTVGSGVAKLLLENADSIRDRTGLALELAAVVDIDTKSPRQVKLPTTILPDLRTLFYKGNIISLKTHLGYRNWSPRGWTNIM